MTRIAVLVSGGGTNLQALIDAQAAGEIPNGEIALVLSNRKAAYALERAKKAGIPTGVLSKYMVPDPEEYDAALLDILTKHRVHMIALAGFLGIIGPRVLAAYENRIVNIHPALIPSFCGLGYYGLRVHEAALQRGVKVTGATAHLVNGEVDGGPILLQKAVAVEPDDTPETLQRRVMEQAEWEILPQAVRMISDQISQKGNEQP
ncbi:MAG: phosphoribosylglycinamide formyltransferase [Clostridia bacterium]|nr:phosphoribosylglycinamide formyltransferase [Clostridia bacterium]